MMEINYSNISEHEFNYIFQGCPTMKEAIEKKINNEIFPIQAENEELKSKLSVANSDLKLLQKDIVVTLEALANLYESINNKVVTKET